VVIMLHVKSQTRLGTVHRDVEFDRHKCRTQGRITRPTRPEWQDHQIWLSNGLEAEVQATRQVRHAHTHNYYRNVDQCTGGISSILRSTSRSTRPPRRFRPFHSNMNALSGSQRSGPTVKTWNDILCRQNEWFAPSPTWIYAPMDWRFRKMSASCCCNSTAVGRRSGSSSLIRSTRFQSSGVLQPQV